MLENKPDGPNKANHRVDEKNLKLQPWIPYTPTFVTTSYTYDGDYSLSDSIGISFVFQKLAEKN